MFTLIKPKLLLSKSIKECKNPCILFKKRYLSYEKQYKKKFVSLLKDKDLTIEGDAKFLDNEVYSSTSEKGKLFEIKSLHALSKYGLAIVHTGNTRDGGIDFKGTWSFPDGERIEVLGQCKNEEKKTPVKYIREFTGSIESKKSLNKSLGIFVTSSDFSVQAKNHFMISKYPMILIVYNGNEDKMVKAYINHSGQDLLPNLLITRNNENNEVHFLYGLKSDF